MNVIKRIIKTVVFTLLGCVCFLIIQKIFTPDHSNTDANNVVQGFEKIENNTIDVLYLGASFVEQGVSSMSIYEGTGITGYSLATAGQRIEISYYLAKKAYESQDPKVIVFDVSQLFQETNANYKDSYNAAWRYVLDNLPIDKIKMDMIDCYSKQIFSDGAATVLFPIVKYHTRWNELTFSDFKKAPIDYFSAGMYMDCGVVPSYITSMAQVLEIENGMLERNEGTVYYWSNENGKTEEGEQKITLPLYDPQISENNFDYFKRLMDLCKQHNTQLILVKIPVILYPQINNTWTGVKSQQVSELAKEYGLPFYDFSLNYNLVDFSTDTRDGGHHLNLRGAEKISKVIGTILTNDFSLTGTSNEQYDTMLEMYKRIRTVVMLESETVLNDYIERLSENIQNRTILIVGSDEFTRNLSPDDYKHISSKLGLHHLDDAKYADAYIGVIHNGNVIYESTSNREISHSTSINGIKADITASGWYSSPKASILINSVNYTTNTRGLHFVVYDNATGSVIDSVVFNTFEESKSATHINPYGLLQNYRVKIAS